MPATDDDKTASLEALRLIEIRDEIRDMEGDDATTDMVAMHLRALAYYLEKVAVMEQGAHELVEDLGHDPKEVNKEAWQRWFSDLAEQGVQQASTADFLRQTFEMSVQDCIEEHTGEREKYVLGKTNLETIREETADLEEELADL